MALRILFWNVRGKDNAQPVCQLARRHDSDIVLLAEFPPTMQKSLEVLLNTTVNNNYRLEKTVISKITMFTRLPPSQVRPRYSDGLCDVVIYEVKPRLAKSILLVVVHLPSALHYPLAARNQNAVLVRSKIEQREQKRGHKRTLIVGDFNLNPFDEGVFSSGGFHAVSSRKIARQGHRSIKGEDYCFFYNPMWSLFGDNTPGPPGTYFYWKAEPMAHLWHMFDQVLVRPELMDGLRDLKIIDSDGAKSLLTKAGRPRKDKMSDHLPLSFELKA